MNLCQNLSGRRDNTAGSAEEGNGNRAVDRKADIIHHLAHAHLHTEKSLCVIRCLLKGLFREGPERDGADQANLDTLLARLADCRLGNTGGGAVGDDDLCRVVNEIFLRHRLLLLNQLIALKTGDDQLFQILGLKVKGVDDIMLALIVVA